MDNLIGTTEAAVKFDIDRSTIVRWAQTGKLTPAQRVGASGAYLFRESDIEKLVKSLPRRVA